MPSVTISELKNSEQIKAWIDAGEVIDLRESDRVVARIVPQRSSSMPEQPALPASEWPDFEALAKEISENRVLPGADLLIEERGRY